jgi:hypothetical protein
MEGCPVVGVGIAAHHTTVVEDLVGSYMKQLGLIDAVVEEQFGPAPVEAPMTRFSNESRFTGFAVLTGFFSYLISDE